MPPRLTGLGGTLAIAAAPPPERAPALPPLPHAPPPLSERLLLRRGDDEERLPLSLLLSTEIHPSSSPSAITLSLTWLGLG